MNTATRYTRVNLTIPKDIIKYWTLAFFASRVVGSIGTENRLKGDHPTARPQDLSDFEGGGALRASRPQAG